MHIQEIYDRYKIPQNLQKHMYTVAGLGTYIADALIETRTDVDKDLITQALLVHDMGNIVKFDLSSSLLIPEEELDYWRDVQNEFTEKYGKNDHMATLRIIAELGVSRKIVNVLDAMADTSTALAALEDNINFAIMFYSDFRVGPHGILSLDDRIDDLLVRYKGRDDHFWSAKEKAEMMRDVMKNQEAKLQRDASVNLLSIQNGNIAVILQTLSSYPIDLNQEF